MRIDTYQYPKSSFLGMPKDTAMIVNKIISSQNVLKLLAYNVKDWKQQPEVSAEMRNEMFSSGQISCVPRINIDRDDKTYLRLTFGTTTRNSTNPEYRDNSFSIDILCHYKHWDLGNFELRPYRLAGEIDSLLDGEHLSGIGRLEFISCSPAIYNEEFAGVSLTYLAIRGKEDEKRPLGS